MSDLSYARWSDIVSDAVTPTQETGTVNANFPLTRANDLDPATATKSTTTGDYALQWDWGSAQRVDAVWIPMYNMPAGTVVHFQLSAAAAWGAPTVDATVTVPAYGGDLPRGLFLDITTASGYSAGGFRYGRLFVPNPSQVTAIGEVVISSRLRTVRNLLGGVRRPRGRKLVLHERNDGGFFRYDRGVSTWRVTGRVHVQAAEYADYLALFEDVRGAFRPFPIVLNPADATPEGFLVQWLDEFAPTNLYNFETLDLTWQMVPRGRAL